MRIATSESNFLLIGAFATALCGCIDMQTSQRYLANMKSGTSEENVAIETRVSDGRAEAGLSASSTKTQVVDIPDGIGAPLGKISFPPGSLAIDTTLVLEASAALATGASALEIGLDGTFGTKGLPVLMTSTAGADAINPFTIALPLPAGAGLADASTQQRLVILYKVVKAADAKKVQIGVLTNTPLSVENGFVKFSATNFGAYQVAYFSGEINQDNISATAAEQKILSAKDEASLPGLVLTSRSPLVAKAGDTINISGKNFRKSMTIALAGRPIRGLQVISDSAASFVMPKAIGGGALQLIADQNGVSQDFSIFYNPVPGLPVITEDPSEVCAPKRFVDGNGIEKTGTKNCSLPSNCSADGQTACIATAAFPAADAKVVLAGNIKAGVKVAGVTGQFPSAAHPLPGATTTPDLTMFITQLTTDGSFEYWDSAGNRGTGSGSKNLKASNIASGISLDNLSLSGIAPTTPPEAADLRYGVVSNGITGQLKSSCRSGGLSLATIDDYNNGLSFPLAGWGNEFNCDGSQISDVTTELLASPMVALLHGGDTAWSKIFRDSYTGLYITNVLHTAANWTEANTICTVGLLIKGIGTWRLPTQKELALLHIYGMRAKEGNIGGFSANLWTATAVSNAPSQMWTVDMLRGAVVPNEKTGSFRTICVR